MNTAASKKFFSVSQANQTLPLVRAIVPDIVELFRDIQERRERLAGVQRRRGASRQNEEPNLYTEELEQAEEDLQKDEERLLEFISELDELGAHSKHPLLALFDFPCLHEGREVCLCWKLGEASIEHWHEVDGGFSGRRPVTTDFSSMSPDQPLLGE
mgnify:CR=1 FL=1